MVNFISSWTKGIIVAVIVASIFEMILPNSKNKKYIKTVIGIYILFNIASPLIGKIFNGTQNILDVSKLMDFDTYVNEVNNSNSSKNNLNTNNEESIKKLYIAKLESDIKCKIEDLDYSVKNISIILEKNDNYEVKRLDLEIIKKEEKNDNKKEILNIDPIEKISINIENDNKDKNKEISISKEEINKIKTFLYNTYNIKIQNVFINC